MTNRTNRKNQNGYIQNRNACLEDHLDENTTWIVTKDSVNKV
jgi:hypothetical protein